MRFLKLFISVVYSLSYLTGFSQQTLTFVLVSEDLKPISYANIFSKSAQSGAYSNLDGKVVLSKMKYSDTVVISCIGYEKKVIMVSDISDTIILNTFVNELKEFVIKSEYKTEEVGITRSKFIHSTVEGNYAGSINGIVFPEIKNSYVKDVSLFIEKPNDSSRTKFMLMIYKVDDSTFFPSELILTRQLFFDVSKKGWSTINLDSLNVGIGGKVFIGIETVPNYDFKDAPNFYEFTDKPCARYKYVSYLFKEISLVSIYGYSGVQYFHHGDSPYGGGSNNNFPLLKATIKY